MNMSAKAIRICAALVALSACAPSVGASQQGPGTVTGQDDSASQSSEGTSTEGPTSGVDTSIASSSSSQGAEAPGGTSVGGKASDRPRAKGPRPADIPFDLPVPIASELSPVCADRGDEIQLDVTTKPGGAIAYQAVYSDNGGGAAVPLGEGYGGNDKGNADEDGNWSSSWIVGLNAPSGPARVDIVVGYEGEFGYDGPEFAVANKDGDCPATWFSQEKDE